MRVVFRASKNSCRQFEMIADVEKFDRVLVIPAELQEGVRARGDDATAELERLRDWTGRRLPDFEIREDDGVADRHPGEKIGVGRGPQEM